MLQMLLSEWLVRLFLLYLFMVGAVALLRHQQQAVSRRFVFSPVTDIQNRWATQKTWCATRATWLDKNSTKDNSGIQIGYKERSNGEFWRNDDVRYA